MHGDGCPDPGNDPRIVTIPARPASPLGVQRAVLQRLPYLHGAVCLGDRLAEGPGIAVLAQIQAPHLPGVDASSLGQPVDLALQSEDRLITAKAAKFPR
ncbi:hypothetical protein D3C72_2296250 [compost metagenome]